VIINQENDIAQIFDGLKKIMQNCLDIKDVRVQDDLMAGDTMQS